MKTLILGEALNRTLSSGTLEIIKKAQDESLDYQVVTIGSDDDPTIGSESFKQTYIKRSSESLQFSKVTDLITKIVNDEGINLILGSSTYLCRDLISFISVDLNSSPVSNVIDFEINGDAVSTINSINGGESLYKSKIASNHSLLLVRPKSFEPADVELNDNYETIIANDEMQASLALWKFWENDILKCLKTATHGKRLTSIGDYEDDLQCCSKLDCLDIVPTQVERGVIRAS